MLHVACLLFCIIEVSTAAEKAKAVDYTGYEFAYVLARITNTEVYDNYCSFNDNIFNGWNNNQLIEQ